MPKKVENKTVLATRTNDPSFDKETIAMSKTIGHQKSCTINFDFFLSNIEKRVTEMFRFLFP